MQSNLILYIFDDFIFLFRSSSSVVSCLPLRTVTGLTSPVPTPDLEPDKKPSTLELPDQILFTYKKESTSRDLFDNLEVLEMSASVSLSCEESPVGWRVSCMIALGSWILLGLAGYFR